MTKIAESYFRLDLNMDESSREGLRQVLQNSLWPHTEGLFGQSADVSVFVEDGSTRVWVLVLGSLYAGITGYGSFRSGIDAIVKDAQQFTESVRANLSEKGVEEEKFILTQRRLGVPGQLKRIIKRIEQLDGDLSPPDRQKEIELITKRIEKVIAELDSEEDYQLIRGQLPENLAGRVPERLPLIPESQMYATRPRDIGLPSPSTTIFLDDGRRREAPPEAELAYYFDSESERITPLR